MTDRPETLLELEQAAAEILKALSRDDALLWIRVGRQIVKAAQAETGQPAMAEPPLVQAQRHVDEGEQRVTKQSDLLARMKADGDSAELITKAEAVIATLQQTVEIAREHVAIERKRRSEPPATDDVRPGNANDD